MNFQDMQFEGTQKTSKLTSKPKRGERMRRGVKIVSCIRDFFTFFKTTLFLLQKQWILFARTIFESKWNSRTEVNKVKKELTKWLCSKELYTWIQEKVTWVWKKKEGKMSYPVMIIEMRLRFTYVEAIEVVRRNMHHSLRSIGMELRNMDFFCRSTDINWLSFFCNGLDNYRIRKNRMWRRVMIQ